MNIYEHINHWIWGTGFVENSELWIISFLLLLSGIMATLGWREKRNEIYELQMEKYNFEIDSDFETTNQSSEKNETDKINWENTNKRPNYIWTFWAWAAVSVWVIIIPLVELTSNR